MKKKPGKSINELLVGGMLLTLVIALWSGIKAGIIPSNRTD